ncbi:hypothetical protein ADT25_03960 [Xanthomonas oryzae]|uniref:CstA N-terminal domain-containing protein n=1 Tax=Xanthomonas oryzae TaxID=347 RepID=A0AAP1EZR8_9XANT|nr:hypothetical protein ADT25_03960 [Xanthomonas oryzae]QBG83170.1 hypothetical protein EYR27_03405 [Xanthomonas oryzae]
MKGGSKLARGALALLAASRLGTVALRRGEQLRLGEHINALWIVVAAMANNDGLNYVPTDKRVLFGHHFAAIA